MSAHWHCWVCVLLLLTGSTLACASDDTVSLVFAGDIVLDDTAGEMIARGEDRWQVLARYLPVPTSALPTWNALSHPPATRAKKTTPFAPTHAPWACSSATLTR